MLHRLTRMQGEASPKPLVLKWRSAEGVREAICIIHEALTRIFI